jgi:hypothetical protein
MRGIAPIDPDYTEEQDGTDYRITWIPVESAQSFVPRFQPWVGQRHQK